jgi:hypothetical protein
LRNPVAQYIRNHVAGIVTSFGFVQDKFKNAACELSINYRHSPLTAEDWHGRKGEICAGDRLPDAPLASAKDGGATTLFQATHGTRYNLLLLGGPGDAQALPHLEKIAADVQQRVPDVFAVHVILPSGENVTTGAAAAPANVSIWNDTTGRLYQQLGVTERALVVVRPDGYIGYRGQPADGTKLLAYLDKYLIRKT